MKTASTRMQAHLASDCTTLARLYKITRSDGNVYTFTDHDANIDTSANQDPDGLTGTSDGTFSPMSGFVYEAAAGFSPTASENKSDLTVDNQEATCFIDSETITEIDVRYGLWDSADVEIRVVNWQDLTMGEVKVRKGMLGNITMKNGVLTAELLGLTNKLQILQGRTYGTSCDAELGDARCQAIVPVEHGSVNTSSNAHTIVPNAGLGGSGSLGAGLFVVTNASGGTEAPGSPGTGTIGSTTLSLINCTTVNGASTYLFSITSGSAPVAGQSVVITGMGISGDNGTFEITGVVPISQGSGFYADGIITFTSGNNSGLSFQVKSWDGTTLVLQNPLFAQPAHNDTFIISPGCGHNVFDCLTKFNNLDNHRGFPTIPGMDSILNYPNATGSV
jgi:uncharacterized phage protein (TIGR02218 family)